MIHVGSVVVFLTAVVIFVVGTTNQTTQVSSMATTSTHLYFSQTVTVGQIVSCVIGIETLSSKQFVVSDYVL